MSWFLLWYATGALGWWLGWESNLWFDRYLNRLYPLAKRPVSHCPTPREIAAAILCGFLGPIALFVGIIGQVVNISYWPVFQNPWWTKPICRTSK